MSHMTLSMAPDLVNHSVHVKELDQLVTCDAKTQIFCNF